MASLIRKAHGYLCRIVCGVSVDDQSRDLPASVRTASHDLANSVSKLERLTVDVKKQSNALVQFVDAYRHRQERRHDR